MEEISAGKAMINGELVKQGDQTPLSVEERKLLDRVGEALARLGRVKRVALNVKDKADFVKLWRKRGRA